MATAALKWSGATIAPVHSMLFVSVRQEWRADVVVLSHHAGLPPGSCFAFFYSFFLT